MPLSSLPHMPLATATSCLGPVLLSPGALQPAGWLAGRLLAALLAVLHRSKTILVHCGHAQLVVLVAEAS